jgi:hypothetical protein
MPGESSASDFDIVAIPMVGVVGCCGWFWSSLGLWWLIFAILCSTLRLWFGWFMGVAFTRGGAFSSSVTVLVVGS